MLILPDWNKPYIIENTNSPIIAKFYWGFSGQLLDYTLMPLTYLEESTDKGILVEINNFEIVIPISWNILIVDPDTSAIDTIPIINCSTHETFALLMSPTDQKYRNSLVKIKDFIDEVIVVHPMMPKGTFFCHPIGYDQYIKENTQLGISIGPYDLHKYINGYSVGDVHSF